MKDLSELLAIEDISFFEQVRLVSNASTEAGREEISYHISPGCLHITRRIANHQDMVLLIFAFCCIVKVLGFFAHLLTCYNFYVPGDVMFLPLAGEGLAGCCRAYYDIGLGGYFFKTFADIRERRYVFNNIFHR